MFMMSLEALESAQSQSVKGGAGSAVEFDALLTKVWGQCIRDDKELWQDLVTEYAAGVNEQKLEEVMRQTLLYRSMRRLAARSEAPLTKDSVALTALLVDELVQQEEDPDSVISVRTRQLLVKTLNLALSSAP